MPVIAIIACLIALVWGAVFARRGSLVFGCGLLVAVAYVVGHEFWHAKVGPVPVTLDRLVLAGLLAAVAVQWRTGQLRLKPLVGADWLLGALLVLLAASALWSGPPEVAREGSSPWGRLIASFVLPSLLYAIARETPMGRREWLALLATMVVLGFYLAATAVCEIAGQWALVFPKYIGDPNLGIHFGRARGPGLNAASLGIYLTACLWCGWTLMGQTKHRGMQLALLALLPWMALGVFLTYTRSTWIGLAASGLVVAALQVPRQWRWPLLGAVSAAGLVALVVAWSAVIGLKREGTSAEAHHSVDQRASFAYVSWQMFKDHPVFGVGFGRFYDRKLPYLSDRRQEVELESIRGLDHHNTLLGVLTETGLVGLAVFCAVLAAWTRQAWLLAKSAAVEPWVRAAGVLMLALMVNYLCSAMFHDLTLLPSQQTLLFLFAGFTVNLRQTASAEAGVTGSIFKTNFEVAEFARGIQKPSSSQPAGTVSLFGMQLARVTLGDAVERVLAWCREPRGDACRFVVTPNVDHAVLFQRRPELQAAYAHADLVLADGAPIVVASRLVGQSLPERVAGSDLVPGLFSATRQPLRVFLLGAAPGVAEQAAAKIHHRWPLIQVVGTCSPPLGFERDDAENAHILATIAAAAPDLLVVGLGAPKQELWVHRHRRELAAKVALCVGATIDFLAGHRQRSPVWMRQVGLEWLHRVLSEPRRLTGRYARDAWVFPQLVWREWRRMHS